jgi:hypothetical protein
MDVPLTQVAAVPRWLYGNAVGGAITSKVTCIEDWSAESLDALENSIIARSRDPDRGVARYAAEARRSRRQEAKGCEG